MTDRAIVPIGVPKLYDGIYRQIDDEQHPEPISLELQGCIGQDILRNGSGAKELIDTIIPVLIDLNTSFFRANEDFIYETKQKIYELECRAAGDLLHIEWAADACRHVCNMISREVIADIFSEVNIKYHLNICEARSYQIQRELPDTKEELINDVQNHYERRLRDPENYDIPKGNEDLLDIDIAAGTRDL